MDTRLLKQGSPEWSEARRGKITASIAPACLRLDGHKGPLAAYNQITEASVVYDNKFMVWGRRHEPEARQVYEAETGLLVIETGFWVHPEHPWLGGSPDGLAGNDGLIQIKCPQVLPESIPLGHRIQCLVELAVTGRQWCDYFAYVPEQQDGKNYFMRRIQRCQGIAGLIERLQRWYVAHIVAKVPPPRYGPQKAKGQKFKDYRWQAT